MLLLLGSPLATFATSLQDQDSNVATTAQDGQQNPPAQQDPPQDEVPPVTAPQTPVPDLVAPAPLIQFQDVPETRVGVDQSNVERLTMNEAIRMAVNRNLDIVISRFDVQTAEYDLFAAKGIYDPRIGAEVRFASVTSPVSSVFGGGGADASVNDKSLVYNASFERLLESGGSIAAAFDNTRRTTDATFSTLNPQYQPSMSIDFVQPIMRNFSIDANRRQIKLAQKQLDLTDEQFRQRIIEIISQVQRAYWDLHFALRNEEIQREAVELARVQLENNLRQVEAGTLAPIELRSTESNLEARKESVISALQQVTTAENTLKNLLLADPNASMWTARIIPVDPATLVPIGTDLESASRAAILNRPELSQLALRTQLKEIDREFFKNQLKPQVDLTASYSIRGLAGTDVSTGTGGGTTLDPLTLGLIDSLNDARAATGLAPFDPTPFITPTDPTPVSGVPERFIGGYGRSIATLFSNDFRTYSVGVRISFPLRNTVAEANYGRTLAELRQLDAEQRRLVQSIQVEVRNALQAVEAARQRYEAAMASRVAAEAQLRGEEERFRAGLSTNFFVLDRQNQLSEARGREAQALTDYNKAIVELQRVTGTTMVVNNVTVEEAAN